MARRMTVGDDRGSLPMALLLVMVGVMSAALLVPIVLTQIHTAGFDQRRNHSLDAARAGIDIIVGKIRDANDGIKNSDGSDKVHPTGAPAKLPCTTSAPVTGDVIGGGQRYQAWVYYFAQDPHGHDDWLDDKTKQIPCGATGTKYTPQYAVVYSQGTDSPDVDGQWNALKWPTRTLQATYVFRTLNTNVPGGLIHSLRSNPDLCLDAGSSSPAANTVVTLQVCNSGLAAQLWSYNSNNTVTLASTDDAGSGDLGMCLTADYPRTLNEPILLQPCANPISNTQKWAYQGDRPRNFLGIRSDGSQEPDGDPDAPSCWTPSATQTVGASLVMGRCWQSNQDETNFDIRRTFAPDPSVGAGSAKAESGYLNNYSQFGRCLDDTYAVLPQTYVIAYYCRSTPDPNRKPVQAQLWAFPPVPNGAKVSAPGPIHLTYNDGPLPTNAAEKDRRKYCLTSAFRADSFPTMDVCNSSANQKWVVAGDTGDYTTSYRITDASRTDNVGLCLQPQSGGTPGIPNTDVSKIIVTRCSGATAQKWNAPPGIVSYPVTDYHER